MLNTMLNRSADSGHPCLIPDLRGKASSFAPSGVISAVGSSYMAFIMLLLYPESFYQKGVELCQIFLMYLLRR